MLDFFPRPLRPLRPFRPATSAILSLGGFAGFVLANGSMCSNQSGEDDIRRAIVEDDLFDCMVALPGHLFYSTQIPVCLWFLARNKGKVKRRDRKKTR